jgi:cell division septal protein FtsQ
MTVLKTISDRIRAVLPFLPKKNRRPVFRPQAMPRQSYTSFQKKGQPSSVGRGLKRIGSFFARSKVVDSVKRNPRTGRVVPFVVVGAFILVLAAIGYMSRGWVAGFFSGVEYFEVQDNVAIDGCRVTTPAEIRELCEVRYHTNLFTISSEKLAAILVRHPWISEVTVDRIWPNKLQIHVVEHVPEALILQGDPGKEELYYMDSRGVAFIAVKHGQDLDFPVITGVGNFPEPDKRKEILGDVLHFLKLVKSNNPNLPAQSISEIHLDKTEGMVVYLVDYPFPIFFGTGAVGKKYKQLQEVLGVLYKHRKDGMQISQVEYIRMDYLTNKVLVAQSGPG